MISYPSNPCFGTANAILTLTTVLPLFQRPSPATPEGPSALPPAAASALRPGDPMAGPSFAPAPGVARHKPIHLRTICMWLRIQIYPEKSSGNHTWHRET